jgi:E3 ubiquitin-protein ligase HUWE1
LTALHCIPYDYANSLASDSLVQVMRTMTDVASSETLVYLQKLVKESLEETKDFWGSMDDESKLLPLLEITGVSKHFWCSLDPLNTIHTYR